MNQDFNKQESKLIFALDIGTRSVTGVVGVPEGEGLRVLHVETMEHSQRAVIDGQIEDIGQTARVAAAVKERLEKKLGLPLLQVHVAAAGRVLKTKRVTYEMPIDSTRPMDAKLISSLESQAIQSTYEELMEEVAAEQEGLALYCVGHSVIKYTLDGYKFSTLLNHRGKCAGVELVATFLPNEVVESLYATMRRVGLTTASVTLEPIAAINAVIPQELRLLNVVLVDVGAGTSDIAIAKGGSVCAYTMATIAGDEITEQIMKELLVDFNTAESIKFLLWDQKETIEYEDILGNKEAIESKELFIRIQPAIEGLAQTISQKILDANQGPPSAVFVVGGGSRTPTLCPLIAQYLGMEENKVAIGGNNYMRRFIYTEPEYIAAEYATPMGIALTALAEAEQESATVTLNGGLVKMDSADGATVMEILVRNGYHYSQIMGRSGKSLTYELDGERKIVRGELPTLASVSVNGKLSNVTSNLKADDVVEFVPAVNGRDADCHIENLIEPWNPFSVFINGVAEPIGTIAWVNGVLAQEGVLVDQMDKLRVHQIFTLEDLLSSKGIEIDPSKVMVNGRGCLPDTLLSPGDRVELLYEEATPVPQLNPVLGRNGPSLPEAANIPEAANPPEPPPVRETPPAPRPAPAAPPANPWEVPRESPPIVVNWIKEQDPMQTMLTTVKPVQVVLNGQPVVIQPGGDGAECYFFDVLNYMDIDPTRPKGEIITRRNGISASYVETIREGDEIEIYWNEES